MDFCFSGYYHLYIVYAHDQIAKIICNRNKKEKNLCSKSDEKSLVPFSFSDWDFIFLIMKKENLVKLREGQLLSFADDP